MQLWQPPAPPLHDDEALSEWLADRVIEAAEAGPGPIREAALQMAGLKRGPLPPVPLSQEATARKLGISFRKVRQAETRALLLLRRHLQTPQQKQP